MNTVYSENRIWAALGVKIAFFPKEPIFTNIKFRILGAAGGAIIPAVISGDSLMIAVCAWKH